MNHERVELRKNEYARKVADQHAKMEKIKREREELERRLDQLRETVAVQVER